MYEIMVRMNGRECVIDKIQGLESAANYVQALRRAGYQVWYRPMMNRAA